MILFQFRELLFLSQVSIAIVNLILYTTDQPCIQFGLFIFVSSHYKIGDLVKMKLKELEATGHFLGQNRRVTLCEADADLEGKFNPDTTHRVLEKD